MGYGYYKSYNKYGYYRGYGKYGMYGKYGGYNKYGYIDKSIDNFDLSFDDEDDSED
jgi:hypothetical protein